MIHKIKMTLLALTSLFALSAPVVVAGSAIAATTPTIQECLSQGATLDLTTQKCVKDKDDQGDTLQDFIARVLNILSLIVGVVAVIMIIVGGFRYVASGGKQESVAAAKNTILYALIGLVIVALAQVVVRFILQRTVT